MASMNDYDALLSSCLLQSKSAAGRQQLLTSGQLAHLASLLPHLQQQHQPQQQQQQAAPPLLVLVRVLRNACAAGAAAADVLLAAHVPRRAAELAVTIAAQPQPQPQLLLAAVQLLSNLAVASHTAAQQVWAALFPERLAAILATTQAEVHEAAALAVLSCARASSQALGDLTTTSAAAAVWLQLLRPLAPPHGADSSGGGQAGEAAAAADSSSSGAQATGNDNVCLLVHAVAVQLDRLAQLMRCVSGCSSSSSSASPGQAAHSEQPGGLLVGYQPCWQHALLLHVLAHELGAHSAAPSPGVGRATAVQSSTADAVEHAAAQMQQLQLQPQQRPQPSQQQGERAPHDACTAAAAPGWLQYLMLLLRTVFAQTSNSSSCSGTVAAHVLEGVLQVLKALLSGEAVEGGTSNVPPHGSRRHLHALGLVQLLLDMLRVLGPPAKPQQHQPQQQQAPRPPYAGYRGDVIAVLCHMLAGQRTIQDEVLAGGGVEMLLNSCNLDDSAPLAREWALWAVRNMCAGNAAVQQHVASFQAVEAVQSPELQRMGKELQLDRMTNKLQLVDKAGPA